MASGASSQVSQNEVDAGPADIGAASRSFKAHAAGVSQPRRGCRQTRRHTLYAPAMILASPSVTPPKNDPETAQAMIDTTTPSTSLSPHMLASHKLISEY